MEYSTFSPDQLLTFAANDRGFVIDILQMFVQQAEEERQKIAVFSSEGKWEEVKFMAHRLRSSAGSVGASNIAKDAAAIESYLLSSGSIHDDKEILTLVERFKTNCDKELTEIKAALKSLKDGEQPK